MLDSIGNSVKRTLSYFNGPSDTPKIRDFVPVEILSYTDLGSLITSHSWSPIIYRGNHRHQNNFAFADFIALDVDGGMPMTEAVSLIKDWECAVTIGSTKSHQISKGGQPSCDRYRVVFPMAQTCTDLEQYRYNISKYLPVFKADGSCRDGARFFFPCTNVQFTQHGWPLDWALLPVNYQEAKERAAVELNDCIKQETLPHWVVRKVRLGVPAGGSGKPGRHSACYSIAWTLTDLGYSLDAITQFISSGPLIEIGAADVRRQVEWGAAKAEGTRQAKRGISAHSEEKTKREANASPAI